jgi:plasmid stabilization system protein ParE
MKLRVDIEPAAELQLLDLDAWWREHRAGVGARVTEEYARIISVLSESPELGKSYAHRGAHNIRRMRMHGTPYRLYYHHERGTDVATIVAVWSGTREEGPPL